MDHKKCCASRGKGGLDWTGMDCGGGNGWIFESNLIVRVEAI